MSVPFLLVLLGSYLLGSVPMGLWIGRLRGVDLREHGSRNIGATNAGRVLGRKFAYLVFLLDFGKGLAPAMVGSSLAAHLGVSANAAGLGAGVAAVVGHVFPLYLRFRGGKGVATAAGAFVGLQPAAALTALGLWVLVFLVTRTVALASLAGAWCFPLACWWWNRDASEGRDRPVLIAALLVAILITIRHRENITRMLRGKELRA